MKYFLNLIIICIFVSACGKDYENILERAKRYYRRGHFGSALKALDQALGRKPNYQEAYFFKGIVHFEMKDYKNAISDWTKTISIKGKFRIYAYGNRGITNHTIREYKLAIKDLSIAIISKPNSFLFYKVRGFSYIRDLQYEKAFADLDKIIKKAPKALKENKLYESFRWLCLPYDDNVTANEIYDIYAWLCLIASKNYNPKTALKYTDKLLQFKEKSYTLMIRAAAFAELNLFEQARIVQQHGIELAIKLKDKKLVALGKKCLKMYNENKTLPDKKILLIRLH